MVKDMLIGVSIKKFHRCSWAVPILAGAVLLSATHARSADLTAYTEEWAPYNYSEGTAVKGISTEILRAACEAAKLNCAFKMVPWARAYKTAQNTPNAIVYTTARKPSREGEFIWIGPILPRTTWIFSREGQEKNIRSFADLAQRRVGVVREEASHQDLLATGIPESALVLQTSNTDVLRMLLGAQVDAMVDTEVGMQWNLRNASVAPNAVSRLMKLSDEGAYYYALNLKSDKKIAAQLQTAIDALRRDGKIDAIVRHYSAPKKK